MQSGHRSQATDIYVTQDDLDQNRFKVHRIVPMWTASMISQTIAPARSEKVSRTKR